MEQFIYSTYTIVLPIIVTALMGYVVWLLKNQKKDRDANSKGTMLLLRVQLIEYHDKYMMLGDIPSYAYENFMEMYDAYETITATDGMEALNKIKMKPDIILLDINMPRMDGIEVCRLIRSKVLCPILFLTARVDEDDKINGLLSGGDDYITKPFSLRELEARIVTNIKREERHQQKTEYRFMDEMLIDYSEKIVAIAGHRMEFTKIEYQIIEFLSMHPGQVFDKERIYAQVCGYGAEGDSRTITELVRRIRKKIADYSEKEYIETVWGIGYRWKK